MDSIVRRHLCPLVKNASNLISIPIFYFKSNRRKTTCITVLNYIGYMEDTFLIHQVERYNILH